MEIWESNAFAIRFFLSFVAALNHRCHKLRTFHKHCRNWFLLIWPDKTNWWHKSLPSVSHIQTEGVQCWWLFPKNSINHLPGSFTRLCLLVLRLSSFFLFVCFAFVFTYSFIPKDMSENTGQQLLVKARFNFQQTNEDELTFTKGDIISVSRQEEGGWWEGTLNGRIGWFPSNYVREVKGSGGCIHFYASSCLILIISNFYRS